MILKRKFIILTLFILALVISNHVLLGQNPIQCDKVNSGNSVATNIQIFNSPIAGFKQMMNAPAESWKPYKWSDIPNQKIDTWLRLEFDNTKGQQAQKFVLGNNQFQYIDYYIINADSSIQIKAGGSFCDHRKMDLVFGANSWFEINVPAHQTYTAYFNIRNNDKISFQYTVVPFILYSYDEFISYQNNQNFFNYFFWGAILLITLYNLALFFQLNNRIYIYYVLNNLFILIFVLSQSGLFSQIFFKSAQYHEQFLLIIGNLAFVFYVIFCGEFLQWEVRAPRLYKWFNNILPIWPALLLLILFNLNTLAATIGGVIAIIGYTVIMRNSWLQIKQSKSGVRYFFYANIFYYVGIIVSMLQMAGVLPSNIFGMHAINFVQIGAMLQSGLFSLTVGYRITFMQQQMIGIVEKQKEELEVKVEQRTLELNRQVRIVEQKQQEIIASITYAKRIQYAILPPPAFLAQNLAQHFIFFQPKDIVSGDFYWSTKVGSRFYLAVCDCTGHGVPGAFMSLLTTSFLNEAINEKKLVAPNEIFDFVRNRLNATSSEGSYDGMDAILLCFTDRSNVVNYAAAHNRPLLVREGNATQLNGDKMPVGKGVINAPFTQYSLTLLPGDVLYCYTDGYADQFGGPEKRKYTRKRLNQALLEGSNLSVASQREKIGANFHHWKASEEQVDDVLIVGIKI